MTRTLVIKKGRDGAGDSHDLRHSIMKPWKWLFLSQATALMIAMVRPVTPSRTGSDWSMAELLFPHPSYLQEVLVYFVLTNLILVLLGAGVLVWVRLEGGTGER